MYCKNCGSQLKEGTRFCDRCGQSVRKSQQSSQAARHKEIEELKAERLNRKKRLAEKEAKQARNKKRRKKKGNLFVFLIVILLLAVVSVIIGYNIFPNSGSMNGTSATNSPKSTDGTVSATPASSAKSGYSVLTIGNVSCPYPADFHANAVSGNEKLSLVDSLGGATMVVRQEGKSGEPKNLMLEYANQGGSATYSRAGDDWYAITIENNGTVTHRKCVVRNGIALYYDFTYEASSSSAKKYEEHISYIDSNFK